LAMLIVALHGGSIPVRRQDPIETILFVVTPIGLIHCLKESTLAA